MKDVRYSATSVVQFNANFTRPNRVVIPCFEIYPSIPMNISYARQAATVAFLIEMRNFY
jgi:hypothetical protein